MSKETPYDRYLQKYIRIMQPGGVGIVGKLKEVDFDKIILSPFLLGLGTELREQVEISESEAIIPYQAAIIVAEISNGEEYLERICEHARLKNEYNHELRVVALKERQIDNPDLAEKLKKAALY